MTINSYEFSQGLLRVHQTFSILNLFLFTYPDCLSFISAPSIIIIIIIMHLINHFNIEKLLALCKNETNPLAHYEKNKLFFTNSATGKLLAVYDFENGQFKTPSGPRQARALAKRIARTPLSKSIATPPQTPQENDDHLFSPCTPTKKTSQQSIVVLRTPERQMDPLMLQFVMDAPRKRTRRQLVSSPKTPPTPSKSAHR